jgi:hypothetical protein
MCIYDATAIPVVKRTHTGRRISADRLGGFIVARIARSIFVPTAPLPSPARIDGRRLARCAPCATACSELRLGVDKPGDDVEPPLGPMRVRCLFGYSR